MNFAAGLNEKLMISGLPQIFAYIQNIFCKLPAFSYVKSCLKKKKRARSHQKSNEKSNNTPEAKFMNVPFR
jgi:hypothetical protein